MRPENWQEGLCAEALVLKVKRHDHTLVTRRSVSNVPLVEAREIYALALELLDRVDLQRVRTRLVGVSATALRAIEPKQQELFVQRNVERPKRLGSVLDAINDRFGDDAIRRAGDGSPRERGLGPIGRRRSPD